MKDTYELLGRTYAQLSETAEREEYWQSEYEDALERIKDLEKKNTYLEELNSKLENELKNALEREAKNNENMARWDLARHDEDISDNW